MSAERLDCRGLACPNPVLKAKESVEQGVDRLTVLVDNAAAVENVGRFLTRMGFEVHSSGSDSEFEVVGSRSGTATASPQRPEPASDETAKIAVLVATDRLGRGDDELGRKLVGNFIGTLKEMGTELWRVILVNGGVKFAVEGSESLDRLRELEESGATVLVCGTCLNHFGLLEKKRVGETTNMLDIITAMQVADKVISIT
ncbi:MAG: sulfurtransferase-like selenium metabolism protein YedF [Desulfobacteraceae bacterium]|nr:sulfurtransferase-like selenium metabolism protein YedF [Desulfobacteraceae bacterium]